MFVGKKEMFAEVSGPPRPEEVRAVIEDLEQKGRTTMIVRRPEHYLGVLGLMDAAKARNG